MYKHSVKFCLLAIVCMLLAAQWSVAAQNAPGPGAGPGPMGAYHIKGQGPHGPGMIPPEKKEVFDAIAKKYRDQSQKLHQDMFAKQAELTGVLAAATVDEAKAKSLTKELNALQTQLNDLDTERKLEMRKQGIPFGPYMLPHHGMMGGMGGMGGHPGKGMGGCMPGQTPPPPAEDKK